MNRFFTLLLAASCLTAVGQCDEIFISEYIEGLANNKALEIYNPTDVAVDLSDYRLERYGNGSTTAEDNQKVDLSGTLEANSVVVIALDKRDPNGVDFESPVWDGLLDAADLWLCPSYGVNNTMYYNGNDAMVLRKISTNAPVDIFGKIGEDPGETGWAEMTQNHTLIRKPNVTAGDTYALDDFLVVDQWDGTLWSNDSLNYTLDEVFVNLGLHTCECGSTVICPEDEDEDGICDDVDDCIGEYDACGICNGSGGAYACGCEGMPEGNCDCDGNQLDAAGVCGGDCLADENGNGVCDNSEVYGCTYELAENYAIEATDDDGSCIFPCEGVVNTNVFDWDGDYVVTVTDFLMMLSVYGDTDVDLDGVWDSGDDCVDTNACNYANDPSEPCAYIDVLGVCGGGCEGDEDNDGICDDIDTCIGVEDECGVCNGPGPTEVVIEDITILYDSVYAENIDTWFVYEIGQDTTFSYTCAPSCGDPVGYQSYDYATVLIGDQCWFAENLRNENYENGDAIPSNLSDSDWGNTSSGAVAIYGDGDGCESDYSPNIDACDPTQSLSEFGRHYNWHAIDDARALCPSGWHVPNDSEWETLVIYLGGNQVAGNSMKSTESWFSDNGNNSSGFDAKAAGHRRHTDGVFVGAGQLGHFWTSTSVEGQNGVYAFERILSGGVVFRSGALLQKGVSIRCIKD